MAGTLHAKQDGNQAYTLMGISGTLGPTYGTAEPRPITVNDEGQVRVESAASLALNTGTITTITAGTQNTLGTVGTVAGVGIVTRIGNIGTIESGTVTTTLALNTGTITTIAAGTQNTLGTVGTVIGIGTVTGIGALPAHAISLGTVLGPNASAGTSTTAPVQVGGTTATGTVYGVLVDVTGHQQIDVQTGTIQSSGTTTGVGVVSALTTGSIANIAMVHGGTHVHPTGTITTGSIANVAMIHNGTLASSGTTTGVGVVTSITNLVAGTITALALGTVRMSNVPVGSAIISKHVLGTAGAGAFWGTILAPVGAGTTFTLYGLSIVVHSGTPEVAVTNNVAGSTGAGVYARGVFPPGGGIMRDYTWPLVSIANGTIAYLINAGTASITANYWVS